MGGGCLKNRGKQFEQLIKKAFEKFSDVSIDRIPDQTMKYKGATNICDFIVYKYPYEYYIECKSVQGNTLSIHSLPKADKKGNLYGFYGDIRDNQWNGLLEKSKVPGVIAGVIIWFIDKDITIFIPMQELAKHRELGNKSVKYDYQSPNAIIISGTKKRTLFDYDMTSFFDSAQLKNF